MRTPSSRAVAGIVAAFVVLAAGAAPALAGHGPLPGLPATQARQITDNQAATAAVAAAFAPYALDQAQRAALRAASLDVPDEELVPLLARAGSDGASLVTLTFGTAFASLDAAEVSVATTQGLADFGAATAQAKLGIDPDLTELGTTNGGPSCLAGDLQAALDAAAPGDDLPVCAGTYAGPLVVRQHFVTLRAVQGPAATVVEAHGGPGIVVLGSGVTVKGFTVQGARAPGAAGIVVGSEAEVGSVAGVVLQDNVLRRNAVGVLVWRAPGTVLLDNVVRDSPSKGHALAGTGLLVHEPPLGTVDNAGVVAVGNSFVKNARFAIQSVPHGDGSATAPTVSAMDHFGSATGPNVQVAGLCVGASGGVGGGACRNAVGANVVVAGFSPVPL